MLNFEFPPIGGGAGNANLELLREFSRIKNLKVDLVTSSPGAFEVGDFSENIRIHRLSVGKRDIHYWTALETFSYTAKAFFYVRRLIRKSSYDLCHCFFGIPCGMIIYLLNTFAQKRLRYIVSLRGFDVPGFNQRLGWIYIFWRPLIRRIWKNAAHVVANSEGLRQLALQTSREQKISVVHNGIDTEIFYPAQGKARGRLLTVSRLIPRKGIRYLILAMKAIARERKDAALTIVGDGPELGRLKRLADSLGISSKVIFLGYVSHGSLPAVYRKADIFILPSLHEGMSNTVLEAMASGLPVVTTDTGGTKELISGNGIVVTKKSADDLSKAILAILSDRKMMAWLGTRSREIALRYSWGRIAGQYLDLYGRS